MSDSDMKNHALIENSAAIDKKNGLAQYEGDEKMYENILISFAKNNVNTLKKLNDAINEGDIKFAHRTAHSLRGAAGAIGANKLSVAALVVEKALSEMDCSGSGSVNKEELDRQMLLLEKDFDTVFNELSGIEIETEEPIYHESNIDKKNIIELLDKLAPLLVTGDTKCFEYMDDMVAAFNWITEEFKFFKKQVESFDFEQAYETIEGIRRFIKQ